MHPRTIEANENTQKALNDIVNAKGGIESGIEGGTESIQHFDTKNGIEVYEGGIEILSSQPTSRQ